jgi:photosystem II stability/assembly factor-like uncharacterized protein
MAKKSLIIGIFFLLLLLLAGNANSEIEPVYAGWTVGDQWNGDGPGTILRSTDSGETWLLQGEGQIADVKLGGVFAVDPYTAWVVGDPDDGYATIYHTTDGGITWQRKGSVPDVPNTDLVKVAAYGDNKVWAVGNFPTNGGNSFISSILHTSDGGVTWINQIPAEYEDVKLQGVHTPDGTNVWVTGGPNKDGYALILKSTDAGLSWTRQSGGDVAEAAHLLGISAVDENTAWAVGGDVIDWAYIALHTTDGGTTWVRQDGVEGLYDANEVYAVNASVVWAACDHSVYWSTNGGESWDNHNVAPYTMDISAVSSQEAWAVRNGVGASIYHTADGGSTWTMLEELNGEQLPQVQTISVATQPINPDYLIISLIEDVEQLVDEGSLNQGQGNALIVKLEHALDRLADDRLKAAINALDAFSNQVDAFVRGGVLPPESGQDLSDQVNYIIELLCFTL